TKTLITETRKNDIELIDNIEELIDLSDFAVEGRYSIICDDIEDSDLYFDLVEKFIIFVKGDKS
ncbi:MAG: hypothetical protein JJW00_04660, partial [Sulfurimonas sp.]|nr:hypothetical protein [Sulfurimonas sp.]